MTDISNLDATSKLKGSTSPLDASSLPGFLPTKDKLSNPLRIRIRYQKLNLDEPGDILELERIETKAIREEGIYVLSKKDFVFMDKIFILISYIEEDIATTQPAQ